MENANQTVEVCEVRLFNLEDKDYFQDKTYASYSSIKTFSKCETLYRDIHIDKTYEEPDKDYFVYGSLVDAVVTEPERVDELFVKVARKINTEDTLKHENKIEELKKEISEKKAKVDEQIEKKKEPIKKKVQKIAEKIEQEKKKDEKFDPVPLLTEQMELSKSMDTIEPNKTLMKGIESRQKEIAEIEVQIGKVVELAKKTQVTGAMWDDAQSTAQAIKTHPYFSQMEFNSVTSQQIFACEINGIPRKGKLDHLKLSPAITKIYSVWKANQLTTEDMWAQIDALNPGDKWAIITDIKTSFSLEKLEPYNPHYRGQLRFYQDLVHHCLRIPLENIRNQILVADKTSNGFKMAELFVYTQNALDELWPDTLQWISLWKNAVDTGNFVSDKKKRGMNQTCFTCTECRYCPFSQVPGEAVVINGPRFTT